MPRKKKQERKGRRMVWREATRREGREKKKKRKEGEGKMKRKKRGNNNIVHREVGITTNEGIRMIEREV